MRQFLLHRILVAHARRFGTKKWTSDCHFWETPAFWNGRPTKFGFYHLWRSTLFLVSKLLWTHCCLLPDASWLVSVLWTGSKNHHIPPCTCATKQLPISRTFRIDRNSQTTLHKHWKSHDISWPCPWNWHRLDIGLAIDVRTQIKLINRFTSTVSTVSTILARCVRT